MSIPRPEYPRPHFDRSHAWSPLNGDWEFAMDPSHLLADEEQLDSSSVWPDRITVPFAWETAASTVGVHWMSRGWYRKVAVVPSEWAEQRVILHFGAVHHLATVWANGVLLGDHLGGNVPFEFDITDHIEGGQTEIVVRVDAPVDKRGIVHGKQRSIPRDVYDMCSFSPSSGIWQSVWLEARPATYVAAVGVTPLGALDGLHVHVRLAGPSMTYAKLTVRVAGSDEVHEATVTSGGESFTIALKSPRLWSPDDPHLYEVSVELSSPDGSDRVIVTTGLRSVEVSNGHLLLNGERLYVRGVLDQGYWPHSGITAPDDAAFVTDIELAAAAGYNVVRKHLKLEDPRFFHHADRLGMLVWAEPASTGAFTPEAVSLFEAQIAPMHARDANHPSIVIWGLYNEEWGLDWDVPGDIDKQDALRRAYRILKALDPHRPIVDNSGWTHVETDLVDWHMYDDTPAGWAEKVRALLVDKAPAFPVGIGGGVVVQKRVMSDGTDTPLGTPNLNGEFGGGGTSVERGWNLRWQTLELRRYDELSGYVYTELYDIEHECAGIYNFDRSLKDSGGNAPATANAETVILFDVDAGAPGRDLVVLGNNVSVSVRVSHHGRHPVVATIFGCWSAALSWCSDEAVASALEKSADGPAIKVEPFQLSEPVVLDSPKPAGTSARLHIFAAVDGAIIGTGYLDVADLADEADHFYVTNDQPEPHTT